MMMFKNILIMEKFYDPHTEKVKKVLNDNNIQYTLIPSDTTSIL